MARATRTKSAAARTVGVILVVAGAYSLLHAVLVPPPDGSLAVAIAFGVLLLLIGVVSILAAAWLGEWWVLLVLLLGDAMITVSVLIEPTSEGQIVTGFFLLIAVLIAAYFLRPRNFLLVLAVGVLGYLAALLANRQVEAIHTGIVISVLVIGVSLFVAHQSRQLTHLLRADPLTGALNRRGLEEEAPLARAVAARGGRETSVVMIDLDGFKALNDEHGHAMGDHVLVSVVRDWSAELREGDILARTGGDEFVIVLPGSSVDDALTFVQRLRAVNDTAWTCGCAPWMPDEHLASALLEADRRMYESKPPHRS